MANSDTCEGIQVKILGRVERTFFLVAPLCAAIGSRKRLIRPEHELVVKKES